jgi:hypothetical protein
VAIRDFAITNKMKKFLALLLISQFAFSQETSIDYLICDEDGSSFSKWKWGIRRVTSIDGYSDHLVFDSSSYPMPNNAVPIKAETEEAIYLVGIHNSNHTESKEIETYSLIINKKDASIKGVIARNGNEPFFFKSQCRIF